MPAITEDEIRTLAAIRSEAPAITTCYLDVDGSRYVRQSDYERVLDNMLRRTRNNGIGESTERDLARIEKYVKAGFDRSRVRGIAMFSSAAHDLWQVVELPVSVRSELVVNSAPAVGQLEAVVQQATTIGVVAVDKTHARAFVYRLGELVGQSEITSEVGRDYDTTGEHDRGGVEEHRDAMLQQHLRAAASLAWSMHQTHPLDHVVIAASDKIATNLEAHLHPYLRERLRHRLGVEPSASQSEIRDAALRVATRIEVEREAARVDELRAAVSAKGRGVAGIDAVLGALTDQRVDRLLVSNGYSTSGWHCPECGRLATVGRTCNCGAEMEHLDDVVEHAVDEALAQSCHVDVCIDNADLDVMGRIGALLRY